MTVPSPTAEELLEKAQNSEPVLIWLDLETTGLDPNAPGAAILEVGVVVCENSVQDNSLEVIREKNWVVAQPDLDITEWAPEVVDMHGKSGLLGQIIKETRADTNWLQTWDRVKKDLTMLVQNTRKWSDDSKRVEPILCGNSVHFDRAWLNRFAPEVVAMMHHRQIDVSSIYETLLRSKHRLEAHAIKENCGEKNHRALADAYTAIHLYEEFRKLLDL